jgi:hypothetical protein
MLEKSNWALAFDEGGSRYGVITTNIAEVFNFVLKSIHSLPVSGIVEYMFHKCKYFVSRWEKAHNSLANVERGGNLSENTLSRARYRIIMLSLYLIP